MDLATNITSSKNHAATNQQQLLVVANSTITVYKECLKNHAASLGGHALDGCGEFMPAPILSPANPTLLKCAACGCHRNFHRRDPDDPCPIEIQPLTTKTTTQVIEYQPLNRHHPPAPVTSPSPASFRHHSPSPPSPPPISSSYYPSSAPQMLLALSSGGAQNPPRAKATTPPPTVQIPAENAGVFAKAAPVSNSNAMRMMAAATTTPNGRKRFRTKFTSGQKEKMQDFAERVGWKMQKRDEETVASLCKEIGVDRGVLKVWMHNNKSKSGDNHHHQVINQTHVLHNNVVASATNGSTNNNNIVRTNNVLAVDINSLNINHSAAMHNLNNHNNGGAIGGLGLHVNGNSYHHDDDDEDESEEDDGDTSPHLGGHASSSSS